MLKVLVAACTFTLAAAAHAQSTAFTYQGQLQSSGQLASGVFDLRFELLNSATGGLPVAPPVCVDNVQVTDGQFTATLDFGAVFAAAGPRFLQISVRPDTGLPCGNTTGLTVLSPRTQITPAPVATHASRASGLRPPNGSTLDAVFVDSVGRVGVGTTTPGTTVAGTKLDVVGGPFLVANSGDQADLLWLASERSWVFRQEGVGAGAALKLQSIGGGGNKHFIIQTDGLVGIGTTTPTAKLHVVGNATIAGPLAATSLTVSPTLRNYTIHHFDLKTIVTGAGSTITRNDTGGLQVVTFNPSEFATSVHLPDDATIVLLETVGRDAATSPGSDIVTTLGRTDFAGNASVMATTTSAGGGGVWNTTSIASSVVDNGTHSYWVRVRISGNPAPADCTLFAVRILFRVTSPLP